MFNDFAIINYPNNISDNNNLGSVNYEFLMSKYLVSIDEYVIFLNNVASLSDHNRLYKSGMEKIISRTPSYKNIKYTVRENINKNDPITYINIDDAKRLCNWLHNDKKLGHQTEDTTEFGAYDMKSNNKNTRNSNAKYWIPNENEWYKSAYYSIEDNVSKYWKYTNQSDTQVVKPNSNNFFSINNLGNYYYQLIEHDSEETLIRGGCFSRQNENSHASCRRFIHKYYTSYYIGLRLCQALPSKNLSVALFNTYGDGWKNDFLQVIDENNTVILDELYLVNGYGPKIINIQIPSHHKNFYIKYISNNKLSYENYYELYDDLNAKGSIIYRSPMYDTPPQTIMVNL